MMNRSTLVSIVLVAAGAVLGWAAAIQNISLSRPALASGDSTPAVARATVAATGLAAPKEACTIQGCCDAGVNPATTIALAAHNQQVAANAEKSGKKPNILLIMGDDVGLANISA